MKDLSEKFKILTKALVSTCEWMLIVAACLAPLCWFGSPADFWFVAVGALVSTVVGCVMVLIQEAGDVADEESCLFLSVGLNQTVEDVTHIRRPAPEDALGFGKGFSHKKVFLSILRILIYKAECV